MKEIPEAFELKTVNDINIDGFPPLRRLHKIHDQQENTDIESAVHGTGGLRLADRRDTRST